MSTRDRWMMRHRHSRDLCLAGVAAGGCPGVPPMAPDRLFRTWPVVTKSSFEVTALLLVGVMEDEVGFVLAHGWL